MIRQILFIGVLFHSLCGFSQVPQNVVIDTQSGIGYPPCEPGIALSLEDSRHLVAGAILNKVYTSDDGGLTWKVDQLTSRYGVFGDPCVIAGPKGDFYYLHLSDPTGKGWMDPGLLDRIVIQRSKNNGESWDKGYSIGYNGSRDQDKEWAAADLNSGKLHVTWTEFKKYNSRNENDSTLILYSRSNRKGKKWSDPIRINRLAGDCLDGDNTVEGAVPAVGPEGEVYVAWALGENIYFDRSLDDGKSWLDNDIIAAEIVGGWEMDIPGINRCNGMPVTRCDNSNGPNRGAIYINWADQRNGEDDTDIWLVKSTDRGLTWSAPVRVNDDPAGNQQFFTWMDVDPTSGYIYIVFYDRRGLEGNETDVYLAVSKDGGESFENRKISEKPFTPVKTVFFGDYNNIAAYGGMVRPIWTHFEDGKLSVRTALIEMQD